MTEKLRENFGELKSRLDQLEKNLIEAIERKENIEITRLNQLIDAKDSKIMELTINLGYKDKKDEIINELSLKIQKLEQENANMKYQKPE